MFKVESPTVAAYKVESTDLDGQTTMASTESDLDISALLALGNIEHGQKVFKKFRKSRTKNE